MTQEDELIEAAIGEITDELSALLSIHARPGRTMAFALVLIDDGQGAGKVVISGDNNAEVAEGLEFLAAQLAGSRGRED